MLEKSKLIKKTKISIESATTNMKNLSNELDTMNSNINTNTSTNIFSLMKTFTKKVTNMTKFSSEDSVVANNFVKLVDDTISSPNSIESTCEKGDLWETYRSAVQDIHQGQDTSLAIEKLKTIYPQADLNKEKLEEVGTKTDNLFKSLESVENKGDVYSEFIKKLELLDSSGDLQIMFFDAFNYLTCLL